MCKYANLGIVSVSSRAHLSVLKEVLASNAPKNNNPVIEPTFNKDLWKKKNANNTTTKGISK